MDRHVSDKGRADCSGRTHPRMMPDSSLEERCNQIAAQQKDHPYGSATHQSRRGSTSSHLECTFRSSSSSTYCPNTRTSYCSAYSAAPADSSTSLGHTTGLHKGFHWVCIAAPPDNSSSLSRTAGLGSTFRSPTRILCCPCCIALLPRVVPEDRTASTALRCTCTMVRSCTSSWCA